jgi:hypothetical protein
MRKALLSLPLAAMTWPALARAQVSEAERAAARELFRQGDELQRASKFGDALDKFQRAQQVYGAPTNLLRIAECDAALGRLVESAEAYRAVLRTSVAGGAAPAFQAAIDQARAELEQVAPRIPSLTVVVEAPPGASKLQLQIDGQSVSAALIGEPIPLDPGAHKVLVFAPGFSDSQEQIELREQDKKTVSLALTAIPRVAVTQAVAPGDASLAAPGSTAPPGATSQPAAPVLSTPAGGASDALVPKAARRSLLLGAHLGFEVPSGKLPSGGTGAPQGPVDASSVGDAGPAYAFDGGVRFAGQWYLGLTLEHAQLSGGTGSGVPSGDTHLSSNTTLLALLLGFIVNPDRPSLYGEVGVGSRWFSYKEGSSTAFTSGSYTSPEVTLGAGVWVPVAHAWRLIPKATVSVGSFGPPSNKESSTNLSHAFFMLGLSGDFNADL